jgi:hypothetical protein
LEAEEWDKTTETARPESWFFTLEFQESFKKPSDEAGCWWLTLVILAIQEAEIRRIMVQSQPGQIVHKTLS